MVRKHKNANILIVGKQVLGKARLSTLYFVKTSQKPASVAL
jgi:ribose 5-phosphate isomerase RpiB